MAIAAIVFQFWRIRAISEHARQYLQHYCQQHNLQLLSVARRKTRLSVLRGKIDWKSEFIFEFSGNGEDAYQGVLIMTGLRVLATRLPAYKIN